MAESYVTATVTIETENGPVRINRSDFDASVHTLAGDEKLEQDIDATASAIELAEEHNVDLADVEGSGANGRIIVADVRSFIASYGDD